MYNRYTPQPDGSFQRNRMQDHTRKPPPPPSPPQPQTPPPCDKPMQPPPKRPAQGVGILDFFRQLLPRELDTADLLIILLLLLMAGEQEEDRNHALLTLALYFFM